MKAPTRCSKTGMKLDWKERRERRFERWLSARGVEFVTDSASRDYRDRIQLLIDALKLDKPERVPVSPLMGFYVTKYSGLTAKEAMSDYQRVAAAHTKFYDDFRPDFQLMPTAPAKVFDLLGLSFVNWPGHGLADESSWQYVEAEYMKADEYDALIADPSDYFRSTFLPRVGSAFAPLATLSPFSEMMEATTMMFGILPFANPAVVEGVQRLAEAARESLAHLMTVGAATRRCGGSSGHTAPGRRHSQGPLRCPGRHFARHQGHRHGPLPAAGEDT